MPTKYPFLNVLMSIISNFMTVVLLLGVFILRIGTDQRASVFLESLITNITPLFISADVSAESLKVGWDRENREITLLLNQATVIGHDTPIYVNARQIKAVFLYGQKYHNGFMVQHLEITNPDVRVTINDIKDENNKDNKNDNTNYLNPAILLGKIPINYAVIINGKLSLVNRPVSVDDIDLTYALNEQTNNHSNLLISGIMNIGKSTVPFNIDGTGVLHKQMLQHLTVIAKIDNATVVAPAASSTELLPLNGSVVLDIDFKKQTLKSTKPLQIILGNSILTTKIHIKPVIINAPPNTLRADIQSTLSNLPMNQLPVLWPDTLASGGKEWVTSKMHGIVNTGKMDVTLTFGNHETTIDNFMAGIQLQNGIIKYLPKMQPITDVVADISFTLNDMQGKISSAKIGTTALSDGKVIIDGFNKDLQNITINAKLTGALASQIDELIAAMPKTMHDAGISRDTFIGTAVTNLSIAFPLLSEILLSDVKISAKSDVKNIKMQHFALPYPITGGDVQVDFDKNILNVAGAVTMNGINARGQWRGNFQGKNTKQALSINATVPATVINEKLPDIVRLKGTADFTVIKSEISDNVAIDINAKPLDVSMIAPNFLKPAGVPMDIKIVNSGNVNTFNINGDKGRVAGKIINDKNGYSIIINNCTLGDNDFNATIQIINNSDKLNVIANGKKLDLTNFIAGHPEDQDSHKINNTTPDDDINLLKLPNATIKTNIDSLRLKSYLLSKVISDIDVTENGINRLVITGDINNKPFSFNINPAKDTVTLKSDDSGLLTAALNIDSDLQGGKLQAVISPLENGKPTEKTKIKIEITDSTLMRAPILARILSIASLSGPLELLTGRGMLMNSINVVARLKSSDIILDNIEMKNASLGLFFTGTTNINTNAINGKGAIVPAYALSKIVSSIPLVGSILTSKDNGIISIQFKISDTTDNPSITVNPLSILPGSLQNLFGMERQKTGE